MSADDRRVSEDTGEADDRVSAPLRESQSGSNGYGASRALGELKFFNSSFSMTVRRGDIGRSGRPVAARSTTSVSIASMPRATCFVPSPRRSLPFPSTADSRALAEIDETTGATLRFGDDQLATFVSSFNAADVAAYRIVGTKGDLHADPGVRVRGRSEIYAHPRRQSDEEGGRQTDQFAPELLYFSDRILKDREPEPSGEEGLQMCESFKPCIDRRRLVARSVSDRFASELGPHHANGSGVPASESRR